MSAPNLDELLSKKARRGRPPLDLPDEVRLARRMEQNRRAAMAQNLAQQALAKLHADDWRSLYEQAAAKVAAERGPLPGDEVTP